jgi:hypothetical protein
VLAVGESAAPSDSGNLEQTGRVTFYSINQSGSAIFLSVIRGLAVCDLVFGEYHGHSNLDGQGERVHTIPVYANCPDSPSEGSTECPIHTLTDTPPANSSPQKGNSR